jgi:hypothetical protein
MRRRSDGGRSGGYIRGGMVVKEEVEVGVRWQKRWKEEKVEG